ncbi:MAG: FAD-dependent oxidoreductase [Streptosporangiales bacterium]|nr:FAD-dependent oxidoreductase [Streptosporangiales bacterium]
MAEPFDVAIIGAGVVGTAVACELAGTGLQVVLLDAGADVGTGTSRAASGILHTGFDATPGTLEARLVARGHHLLAAHATRTGIPVERCGALLVAWTADEFASLASVRDTAERNGYRGCEIVGAAEVYLREPQLGPGARGGMWVPDEAVVCGWTTTLAYATEAVQRGVELRLRHEVQAVRVEPADTALLTNHGTVRARWVVNAAGLGADTVDRMLGHRRLAVTTRRGEVLVFDRLARPLVNHIVRPVPAASDQVPVSPTVYGTVLLGPTSGDVAERTTPETTERGIGQLLAAGRRLMPGLVAEEVTASYAGLHAATDRRDYVVAVDADQRYLLLGGFGSTGLTASMALAEHTRQLLADAGLRVGRRASHPAPPRLPNLGETGPRPYQQADHIAADPDYGRIVCYCERVSHGEIRDALQAAIPPTDLGGLRRRTRAMAGSCQGSYCGAELATLFNTARRGEK